MNLDRMFSLDNFQFSDIKVALRLIIENLAEMSLKIDKVDGKVDNLEIPDISKINQRIQDVDLRVFEG